MKVIVDPRDRCEIQRRDFTTTVRVKPECGHATGGDVFNLVKDTSCTIMPCLASVPLPGRNKNWYTRREILA